MNHASVDQSRYIQPAHFREPRPHPLQLDIVDACSDVRCTLESQIAERFARNYSAQITHFLPLLISLRTTGRLTSVVGLQVARDSKLFVEQYFDTPVEQVVSGAVSTPVDRRSIVEIGNLAAIENGKSSLIFSLLAITLYRAGLRWVVCTATPQVQDILASMGFETRTICHADAKRLDGDRRLWGDYYSTCPKIITGNIEDAANRVMSAPKFAALADELNADLDWVVARVLDSRP